jgi:hypothetical protein
MTKLKFQKRGRPLAKRKQDNRKLRETFLIICEGKETEPNYFLKFRAPRTVVVGIGKGGLKLVEEAIKRKEREKEGRFTQIWCVFDKDETPDDDFNQALRKAKKAKIQVAYSNEAFELWFYLHFKYHSRHTHRAEYEKLLSDCLGSSYEKNQADMYDKLLSRQSEALKNAARLLASYQPHDPALDNPCTTVHKLVEVLNNSQAV